MQRGTNGEGYVSLDEIDFWPLDGCPFEPSEATPTTTVPPTTTKAPTTTPATTTVEPTEPDTCM